MKRLFVSDLDGTLLNRQAQVSDETARIINREIAGGLAFSVATARTPDVAFKLLAKLNLNLPVILMNGAVVYDMASGTYVKKSVLNETVVMVLLGLIKTKGLNCFLSALDNNRFVAYYDSVESTSLNYFRNEMIMKYDQKFTEVEDLSLITDKEILSCMLREPKDKLEGLYRELSVVKGVKAEFYPDIYSEDYYMLEIYEETASKQEALRWLRTKGRYDSIVSFGDNLNDKALLEGSDYFYAVSNAHPEIQHMADSVIPSNEEDGVARFIEQMCRME